MKKSIIYIVCAAALLIGACNKYDDGRIKQDLDLTDSLLTALETKVAAIGTQMEALNSLAGSRFISFLSQDTEGNYVISYRTGSGSTKTVTIATDKDVVTAPIVSIAKDDDGNYYWRATADNGATYYWLTDAQGNKMIVGGKVPVLAIDSEGYWTVDGEQITDSTGKPVLANDISNILFRSVEKDEQTGRVKFVLTDGTEFEIEVFETIDILFDHPAMNAIADRSKSVRIKYEVTGSESDDAVVDCFTAYNVTVAVDKAIKTISVTLDSSAESGNAIIAVFSNGNTVLKPLFFTYGTAEIGTPQPDAQYAQNGAVVLEGEMTSFDIKVSANIDYEVTVGDSTPWLIYNGTRAEMVTTTHRFTADYYENAAGTLREGYITFSNRPYDVSVTIAVKQTPTAPISDVKGISTPADMVAFAAAVNASASTTRWQDDSGAVILANDIDMSTVTEWTPIGSYTDQPVNGFDGIFDGKGFKITGIKWTIALSDKSLGYGLFGCIKGGTVRNLTLGGDNDQITYTGSSVSGTAMAALAGYVVGGTIANCENNVGVSFEGDDPAGAFTAIGSFAGYATEATILGGTKGEPLHNYGKVVCGKITNTDNGGTGMTVGGIVGYLGDPVTGATTENLANYCFNHGSSSAPTGRGGGIVGTMAYSGHINNCTNDGQIEDDVAGQFDGQTGKYNVKRMGGIVGGSTDTAGNIENCTNNGNIFSHIGCRTGGIAGHCNSKILGCINGGTILSDITAQDGAPQHGPGWLCGYGAKGIATYCTRGGRVGEYTAWKDNPSGAPEATNDNAFCYKNSEYYDPSLNY